MRFLLIALLFIGCAYKQKSVYIVMKSKHLRVADSGFIKEGNGFKEIIIYKSGVEPIKITLKNSFVCVNSKCMDKRRFINEFFGDYPSDFFDKIIEKKPIKLNHKFIYKIGQKKVLFKDKNLTILIKEIE